MRTRGRSVCAIGEKYIDGITLEATGGVDAASLELSAAVAASGGARTEYDEPVDLSGYDRALGLAEGGGADA